MKRLRIVHCLHHGRVRRGGAFQALLLARGQLAQGHDVQIVCNSDSPDEVHRSFDPWQADGLHVHPFRIREKLDFRTQRELVRYRRFLSRFKADVVHTHRDSALQFTYFATLLATPPAFIAQRGTTTPLRTRTIARIHRSKRLHRVIVVAQAVKDSLVDQGVDQRKIEVVYGSYDVDRFAPERSEGGPVREEIGVDRDQKLIVQVGELNEKKAPIDFVRTAHHLLQRRNDVTFALVGVGGMEKQTKAEIERLGIGDRVKLLGFRRDIPEIYAAADVVVNSSIHGEGLTGAIREAMAMARPVAATRVCGNPEVVHHGETGLLVDPSDAEAMADAVTDLIEHPERARSLGQAAHELVSKLMNPARRFERVETIYRQVLEERAGGKLTAMS